MKRAYRDLVERDQRLGTVILIGAAIVMAIWIIGGFGQGKKRKEPTREELKAQRIDFAAHFSERVVRPVGPATAEGPDANELVIDSPCDSSDVKYFTSWSRYSQVVALRFSWVRCKAQTVPTPVNSY